VTSGLAQFLRGIPDVVWSGVFAAIVTFTATLGGVLATNRGNLKRLKLELEHDAAEKTKERLATLRRDLYLRAVETNVRGLACFGTLPQADLTKPEAGAAFQDVLAMGAQLQLVVSQGTAQLISDLVSAYGELQLKLVAKVLPLHNVRSDINIRNVHYEDAQAEIKRVLAAMTQYNESGQRDPELFGRLNRSFEFARNRAQQITDERKTLWDQSNSLQRQFLKDLLPELKRIGELQIYVLVELRRELDVGGDIEIFRLMMRRQMERAERAINEFDRTVFGANP